MSTYRYQEPASTGAVENCQQCESIFISGGSANCNDFCDGVINWAISDEILSPHNYASTTEDDIITPDYGEPDFTPGWYYAYAATSTDTDTGTYQVLQIKVASGFPNEIGLISHCGANVCVSQ